jgi:hypothetical protein
VRQARRLSAVRQPDLAGVPAHCLAAVGLGVLHPLFQSTIPEILKEERDYTRALSLSRLAYDLESLLSPRWPLLC